MTPADLKARRIALGLSRRALADALDMGKWGWQTIGRWERGDWAIPRHVTYELTQLENEQ